MPRSSRGRTAAVLAVVGALVALVLLVRPGTAVDEAGLEAALPSTPVPSEAASAPPLLPEGALVVRPDGVDGLRLGMGEAEVTGAGFVVGAQEYEGCRRILPGVSDTGPGPGLAGWLVDGEVAAVTLDARVGPTASFLGPGLGGRLGELAQDPGVVYEGILLIDVPWQDEPFQLDVTWVAPEDTTGVTVSFADTLGDGVISHVQVRAAEGGPCARAYADALARQDAELPLLDLGGWGDLRLGMTVEQAQALVRVRPPREPAPQCGLLLGDGEPGLAYLVVSDGQVAGIAVDAGSTAAGLPLGSPPQAVREAYPEVLVAFLDSRWSEGLAADWQYPEGEIRFSPTREKVRVPEVDAVVSGPRDVVGLVQVGPGC